MVAVVLAQGGLGMVQYLLGVPALLVSAHVLGAMLMIVATAGLWCATRERGHPATGEAPRAGAADPVPAS